MSEGELYQQLFRLNKTPPPCEKRGFRIAAPSEAQSQSDGYCYAQRILRELVAGRRFGENARLIGLRPEVSIHELFRHQAIR